MNTLEAAIVVVVEGDLNELSTIFNYGDSALNCERESATASQLSALDCTP
jgi:hypothetical protein